MPHNIQFFFEMCHIGHMPFVHVWKKFFIHCNLVISILPLIHDHLNLNKLSIFYRGHRIFILKWVYVNDKWVKSRNTFSVIIFSWFLHFLCILNHARSYMYRKFTALTWPVIPDKLFQFFIVYIIFYFLKNQSPKFFDFIWKGANHENRIITRRKSEMPSAMYALVL